MLLYFISPPGKANVVVDALSRKLHHIIASFLANQPTLYGEFQKLNLEVVKDGFLTACLALQLTLKSLIKAAQLSDN